MSGGSGKKRMLAWIRLAGILLVFLILAGGGYFISQAIAAKQELADLILAGAGSSSVAAYTFDETGELVEDDGTVFIHADEPRIMASTMKIVVLAAYADAIANGDIAPQETVRVADWESYYLPMSDGNAHLIGLKSLGMASDELGFARDQAAQITLDDLARLMTHYSENAATDYLIQRLGTERMTSILEKAGIENHTPVGMTLGVALAALDHENPSFSPQALQDLAAASPDEQAAAFDRLVQLYTTDPKWRAAQIDFMISLKENAESLDPEALLNNQVLAVQFFPQGTAREYAQLMAKTASGRLISVEVSGIMQEMLESVPGDWPLDLLFYERFGAKDGIAPGVLTMASYALPSRGRMAGQSRVVVVLANQLPLESWMRQVQFQGHYLLGLDLARAARVFAQFSGN